MKLKRHDSTQFGIFGELLDDKDVLFCVTLEHAYEQFDGSFIPKIPAGTFKCIRGSHTLNGKDYFETFEITGVPGHSGILFHPGNWNQDSSGCVLVGSKRMDRMICDSRITFAAFMKSKEGINEFDLVVE